MCGKAAIYIVGAVNLHAIWKSKSIRVPEGQQRLQIASSASSCSRAVFIHQTVQRAVSHQGTWGFISQAGFVSLRGMELSSLHQATLERFSCEYASAWYSCHSPAARAEIYGKKRQIHVVLGYETDRFAVMSHSSLGEIKLYIYLFYFVIECKRAEIRDI